MRSPRFFWRLFLTASVSALTLTVAMGPEASIARGEVDSTPSPGSPVKTWAALNGLREQLTLAEAVNLAAATDLIVAADRFFDDQLAEMRHANPDLLVLGYQNGVFSPPGRDLPEHWYVHDSTGQRVSSTVFDDNLMNPRNSGWVTYSADRCASTVERNGYDGCYVDMLGVGTFVPGNLTSTPINTSTMTPWELDDWLRHTSKLLATVKTVNPTKMIIGNGLNNGMRYWDPDMPTSGLIDQADGANAESFVRAAMAPVDRFRPVDAWQLDLDMLNDMRRRNRTSLFMSKVWMPATQEKIDQWHAYALATFLLGTDGHQYFMFTFGEHGDKVNLDAADRPNLGDALGAAEKLPTGVRARRFTNGIVLVNPGDSEAYVDLGGVFRLSGSDEPITDLRIQPNVGVVLTKG